MKKLVLSLLAFSALNATAQIPTNGLIEHFTFDNTFIGVNGTNLSGTANYQNDRNGNTESAHYLGYIDNVCIDFGIPNFPTIANSSKSVAFWFKHASNTTHSLFSFNVDLVSGTRNGIFVAYENNEIVYGSLEESVFTVLSSPLTYNTDWTHLALSFDGTQIKLYINGTLIATDNLNVPHIMNGLANIGASPGDEEFYAFTIDDLLIYNTALSAAEVTQIFETNDLASLNNLESNLMDIYPNPTNGLVNISNIEAGTLINVSDASGRVIATQIAEINTTSFDLSNQENGVYFVSFQNTDGSIITKKLIVRK